jgi:preprotein translocase subunit SecG
MTFLAINWLNISIDLLLVVFVIVCLMMTLVILMQRPKQEGLGAAFGGGVTDQVFGARTTNVLQRGTVYLGSMFFILSLLLAVLIGQKNRMSSTVNEKDLAPAAKVEEAKPTAEEAPKSLSEELPPADPAPVTPAPAEVPADASTPAPATEPAPAPEPAAPAEVAPPAEETAPEAPPAAPAGEASGTEKTGE